MKTLSALELAGVLGLSKGRISQLVSEGKLDGCYRGDGRDRRFDLEASARALNSRISPVQRKGNGARTQAAIAGILGEIDGAGTDPVADAPFSLPVPLPDELRAAAELVAGAFPRAAAALRTLSTPAAAADPRALRKLVLRRLWRRHHLGMSRTAAARLLATEWAAWRPMAGPELPDTLADGFARLARLGVSPLGWRTIADDLDPECLDLA